MAAKKSGKSSAFGDSYQRRLSALRTEFRGIVGDTSGKYDGIAAHYIRHHKDKKNMQVPEITPDPFGTNGIKGIDSYLDVPHVYIAMASRYAGIAWPQGYAKAKACLEQAHDSLGARTISQKDRVAGIKTLVRMASRIAEHARDNYNQIANDTGEVNADKCIRYAQDIVDLASQWVGEIPKPARRTTKRKSAKKGKP